ncbi:PfkB family carbohydrate kinase [Burkholderia ubonensis]|uniref:PfkB family carbohydrate kinase n=1 Tax=Burkholderia ubonensis TaxID=101571 RepID=UPI00075965BA|nr:PfkB family carbohydrate kinase [Burkholderia ubonensis]KVP39817.1 hypothetical protein WJ87_06440 [Burkholderia ubonensis]
MPQVYLLAGSYAYDTVFMHPQAFSARIKRDALDKLNASFNLESVIEAYGGCAGNIAKNASLLGDAPMLVGNVGHDGGRYLSRIQSWGLDTTTVGIDETQPTAHAWILTDVDGNQLTSFHAGAMKAPVRLPSSVPALWHIAPEDPVNMVKLALAARAAGAEYFFDPGQALPSLLNKEASHIAPISIVLREAKGIFVNEYEAELLRAEVGDLRLLLTAQDQFIIRTRGAAGVDVIRREDSFSLPPAVPERVVDPTGCGDAFRAGFLHLYVQGHCLEACVAMGAVMGALVVASEGGQNHFISRKDIYARLDGYRASVFGATDTIAALG